MIKISISNTTLIRFPMILMFFLLIGLSGCQSLVPATTPPQLGHTPGAPLTITDTHIDAGWFSLDYPDGWRVVTNVAIDPLRLTLVSPDDEMVIRIYTSSGCAIPESTPEPGTYWRDECAGDYRAEHVHVSGTPSIEFQDIYDPIFDALVASIQFN